MFFFSRESVSPLRGIDDRTAAIAREYIGVETEANLANIYRKEIFTAARLRELDELS